MMKPGALVSSLLLSLSLLVSAACDSDDDDACADGSCESSEPEPTSEPSSPPPTPIPCRPACEALAGSCGADAPGDTTAVRAVAECIDWCEAGGLSADEAACLETLGCDQPATCLAD